MKSIIDLCARGLICVSKSRKQNWIYFNLGETNIQAYNSSDSMFVILIILTIILLIVYVKFKYFTLRGPIPGIPPQFLLGNLIQTGFIRGAAYFEIYSALRKRFGDVFQIWFGHVRFIVVSNVGDIQHIFTNRNIYDQGDLFTEQGSVGIPSALICTKGAKFKRHSAAVVPLFRRAKVLSNLDLIIDWVDKLLDKWRAQSKDHVHTNLVQQSQSLLLQIFGFIGFNFNLGTLHDPSRTKRRNELNQAIDDIMSVVNVTFFAPRFLSKIYLALNLRYRRARTTIEKYLYRMIDQELNETEESRVQRKRTSLIASLVSSLQQDEKLEATKREEDKRGLSRAEILDEMISFLVVGSETTATTLSWFIYGMSKHPRVQQKIKAELKDDGGRCDLSVERLDSLVYLDCVINEVLRYYAPVVGTTRTLTTDDRLPVSGFQLRKGEQVSLAICVVAKDPRLWSVDPELFYPERFLNEDKNHHPYAFLPFGAGHRQCVGQDLARFELKVILARMMQYVTFGDGGPELNAGGYIVGATTKPKKLGVTIQFADDE